MTGTDQELLDERYSLVMDGIRRIKEESAFGEPLLSYFNVCADMLDMLSAILDRSLCGGIKDMDTAALAAENHALYEDILGRGYDKSFTNPDYITALFEKENIGDAKPMAQYLSYLLVQIRGLIPYAYEGKKEIFTIHAELFAEIYSLFSFAALEGRYPEVSALHDVLYWFIRDDCEIIVPDNISQKIDPSNDFLTRIVCDEDLDDERYLYLSGEYVSENEKEMAAFISKLPEDTIDLIASTFTEGYRMGFVAADKPLEKKNGVNIRYSLGFERIIRKAVENFAAMGLEPVIYRAGSLSLTSSGTSKVGFYGAVPNRQYDYDHKDDLALFIDADLVTRRIEVLTKGYEAVKEKAYGHAGPAVMEVFGEVPFTPAAKESAVTFTDKTRKLSVDYSAKASLVINRYIIPEERSFTIIAFPSPEIGDDFEKIFFETVKLNTLPYKKYETIQQKIIDALDKAGSVRIKGKGDNRTDLTVNLMPLSDPATQSHFENCVADVNIPVGEVFTSPKLSGTNGVLNVSKVYLNGILYKDLSITFTDGMITDYSCANYEDAQKGRQFIKDNILHKHDSLPMGEFAIGTNTTAYRMGRDFDIEGRLPILIAEKTGPHFAVGDTCYSHEEDVRVYNPDKKEIISRENEVSAKRHTNEKEAYFQCHTDITIAFDELLYIRAVTGDGDIPIIENGRFVLPGTAELNEPLDRDQI
ncbi:MAG: aminopeptidase [Lachnospiraceae bacterium]|nr:aminopeptidase [Lachnospiraceae bacterium]